MDEIYIVSKRVMQCRNIRKIEYTLSDGSVLLYDELVARFGVKRTTFAYRTRIYGLSDIRVLQAKKINNDITSTKERLPKKIIGMSVYNDRNMFMSDEGLIYFISDIEKYFGISQYQIRKFLKNNSSISKDDIDLINLENTTKNQKEKQGFNRSIFCIKNGVECDNYSNCLDEMIICRSKNKKFKPKSENCYINRENSKSIILGD